MHGEVEDVLIKATSLEWKGVGTGIASFMVLEILHGWGQKQFFLGFVDLG